MKGPLTAETLFFISAFASAVSFVLYAALNYIWPYPADPTQIMQIPASAGAINQVSWFLGIAGVVIFILGLIARRR